MFVRIIRVMQFGINMHIVGFSLLALISGPESFRVDIKAP